MESTVTIVEADLADLRHQQDIIKMTQAYAMDEMGNDSPLPDDVINKLIPGLQAHPTTKILLAYIEDQAVGIATCFFGFSTFAASPLLNIHDFAVLPEFRGRGIGKALMSEVDRVALKNGCVKVTLEVQENNARARQVYKSAGFAQSVYGSHTGGSLFYSKLLTAASKETTS